MDIVTCTCGREYNAEALVRCPACGKLTRELFMSNPQVQQSATGSTSQFEIAPGWYPDPNGMPADRYWDGTQWGDQTRPQAPRPTPPPPPPRTASGYPHDQYRVRDRSSTFQSRQDEGAGSGARGFGILSLVLGLAGMVAVLLGFSMTGMRFVAIWPCGVAVGSGIRSLYLSKGVPGAPRGAAQWGLAFGGTGGFIAILLTLI